RVGGREGGARGLAEALRAAAVGVGGDGDRAAARVQARVQRDRVGGAEVHRADGRQRSGAQGDRPGRDGQAAADAPAAGGGGPRGGHLPGPRHAGGTAAGGGRGDGVVVGLQGGEGLAPADRPLEGHVLAGARERQPLGPVRRIERRGEGEVGRGQVERRRL